MRKSFIAGNWKMNLTVTQAVELAKSLVKSVKDCPHRVLIAPNFTCLDAVSKVLPGSPILLGAQNMAFAETGAYTGETSVLMLKDVGVQVVILGHSERRSIYNETDEIINKKVKLALTHGLEVILCVGETLEEREAGRDYGLVSEDDDGYLSMNYMAFIPIIAAAVQEMDRWLYSKKTRSIA